MFERKHFQPQKNSILLQKGSSTIVNFCTNIAKIVDKAVYFGIDCADNIKEGEKKDYKRFLSSFYSLMVDGTKIDSIIEEMWSRIYAKKFDKYSPAQGYYEALRELKCDEKTIDEVKFLRDFRNLCCHSISLKDSLAEKKNAIKYLLAIKPIVRSLYKKTVESFENIVTDKISDDEFDAFLKAIIQDRNKKQQEFKKESFLKLYGLKEDKKYNCKEDKKKILDLLKGRILKRQEDANKILEYTLCSELIVDVGCLLEQERGETTYNQILLMLRSLGEIVKLEERVELWGKKDSFKKLHEIFDLKSSKDVNGRKQIRWRNVYLKNIIELYAVISQGDN